MACCRGQTGRCAAVLRDGRGPTGAVRSRAAIAASAGALRPAGRDRRFHRDALRVPFTPPIGIRLLTSVFLI
jgi:hypothetical protein